MTFAIPRIAFLCLALAGSLAAANAQPAPGAPATSRGPSAAPAVAQPETLPVEPRAGVKLLPPQPEIATDGTGTTSPKIVHDLSPWSMFLSADILVKGVMVGLMLASLVTWTIFAGKTLEMGLSRRRLRKALTRIEGATMMSEARLALRTERGFLSGLIAAASLELDLSGQGMTKTGVKERADSRFADLVRAEMQGARRGMGALATIGSTAPFVGLFGTVWGIMNSFIGISKAQTTNLAVVAPGIAEALLATAIGLVAAIPAVIIYNHFSRAARSYQLLVSRAAGAVGRLLSRELDRGRTGAVSRVAD